MLSGDSSYSKWDLRGYTLPGHVFMVFNDFDMSETGTTFLRRG